MGVAGGSYSLKRYIINFQRQTVFYLRFIGVYKTRLCGVEFSVPAEGVATLAGIRSGMFLRLEKWNCALVRIKKAVIFAVTRCKSVMFVKPRPQAKYLSFRSGLMQHAITGSAPDDRPVL